jgi:hypothetical protein
MKIGSFDAVTNRETFQTERQIIDIETGEAIDLTGASLVFEICDPGCRTPRLSVSTDDGGIVFLDAYTYQVTISEARMSGLCAGTYDVYLKCTRDDFTAQIIAATLPVLDGGNH